MKRILITGKNSYVGTSLDKWLSKYPDKYSIDSISLRDESWKKHDFSKYDVVFHVAGIAHIKETKKNAELYYKVNRDLAYETAKKAKQDGVKQFIFLSSMSVYGLDEGIITDNTPLNPKSNYGKSKLQAEKLIKSLEADDYMVAIIRPPMIYGKGSKGNYLKLSKAAQLLPIFPDIDNERSMLHIDNLCEFIRLMIDNEESGLFFPQNKEYVKTSEMVKLIAEVHDRKIKLTKVLNPILKIIGLKIGIINKVFGNLVYYKSMSNYKENYWIRDFHKTIELTEME